MDHHAARDALSSRIRDRAAGLTPAMLRAARFIEAHPVLALSSSAADLAARSSTSDATVVRTAKALGFKSLAELRGTIAEGLGRQDGAAANMARTLAEVGADVDAAVSMVLDTHAGSLERMRTGSAADDLRKAVGILHQAQRVVLFGVGQTAPLIHYAAMMFRRAGRRAITCDAFGAALADQLLDLAPGDVLLALAYGAAYPEIEVIIRRAREHGVPVVLVSDSLEERVANRSDLLVRIPRGETGRVALHAATLAAIEALGVGMAAADPARAMRALEQLEDGRRAIVEGTGHSKRAKARRARDEDEMTG